MFPLWGGFFSTPLVNDHLHHPHLALISTALKCLRRFHYITRAESTRQYYDIIFEWLELFMPLYNQHTFRKKVFLPLDQLYTESRLQNIWFHSVAFSSDGKILSQVCTVLPISKPSGTIKLIKMAFLISTIFPQGMLYLSRMTRSLWFNSPGCYVLPFDEPQRGIKKFFGTSVPNTSVFIFIDGMFFSLFSCSVSDTPFLGMPLSKDGDLKSEQNKQL